MSLFPFSREGRQTLIYIVLAGCGPALTGVLIWAMVVIREWEGINPDRRLDQFAKISFMLALGLLIIIIALACFVSIRAVKIGRDGIEAESNGNGGDAPSVTVTASAKMTPAPSGDTNV